MYQAAPISAAFDAISMSSGDRSWRRGASSRDNAVSVPPPLSDPLTIAARRSCSCRRRRSDVPVPVQERVNGRTHNYAVHLTSVLISALVFGGSLYRIDPVSGFVGCRYSYNKRVFRHLPIHRHRPNNANSVPRQLTLTSNQDCSYAPALSATCDEKDGPASVSSMANEKADSVYEVGNSNNNNNIQLIIGSENEWREYHETADEVLSAEKTFGRKDTEEDKDAVRSYLLRRECTVPIQLPTLVTKANATPLPLLSSPPQATIPNSDAPDHNSFHLELETQKTEFGAASGLTSAQQKLALRVLGYIGNYCAKRSKGLPLRVGWQKLKEMGASPRENVLSTYLYGLALAEESGDEPTATTTTTTTTTTLPEEVATFHDSLFSPTEKTLTLRIKALVQKGDAAGAERLLEMMPSNKDVGDFRLRTYLPVLELYCEQGNIGSALGLYKRMRRAPGVHFNAENYSLLISAVAERGFFRDDSAPIDGAADIGYHPAMGPQLLSALVSEMAEDVLEITSSCASRLRAAFIKGFGLTLNGESKESNEEVPIADEPSSPADLVADRVCVDDETALCPRTEARLRLIALDKVQRSQLHTSLEEMANSQYAEYDEKLKQRKQLVEEKDEGYASKQLRSFADWIDGRDGDPFTAIVDGANVAFFGRGVVDYHHVKSVVEGLEKMGENPLVIMPQKYLQRKFYIRKGNVQELSDRDWSIVEELVQNGKVYEVKKRCLDDYYWMLASVSDQTVSRKGAEIDVPPNNQEGRWPGLRPLIVSNDQMRDHKLELLQPRLFRRWVSSFIIKYDFSTVVDGKWDEREAIFSPAEHFSREIQENLCPDGRATWHFPVCEWEKDERFCIRLPAEHS